MLNAVKNMEYQIQVIDMARRSPKKEISRKVVEKKELATIKKEQKRICKKYKRSTLST